MTQSVGQYLIALLHSYGVDTVFGHCQKNFP